MDTILFSQVIPGSSLIQLWVLERLDRLFLSGWAQNENCHLMTGNADQSFFKRELATVSSRASEQRRTF